MSIAVGKLTELPQNRRWIYGVGSRRGRETARKKGREILEVGKGGMWQNGSELKIRNRDEIRENIMGGMDKGAAYTERTSE